MKIMEFLQEDNGSFSATRLAFLLWLIGVLATWIFISIKNSSLTTIPDSVITLIGILMTGKVVQKFGEKSLEWVRDKPTENAGKQPQKN